MQGLVDLVGAALSERNQVDLLDRGEIAKVLAEHKLATENRCAPDQAVQLGKLIACDIIADFHAPQGNAQTLSPVNLVVFDAVTGMRIIDTVLPRADGLEASIEPACSMLLNAVRKWIRAGEEAEVTTVSVVSTRNMVEGAAGAELSASLQQLLERALLRSPQLVVLERQRLEHVNEESRLTRERRDRLLTAAVRINIDVSGGTAGKPLAVSVRLVDSGGAVLGRHEETGKIANLQRMVEAVADHVVGTLQIALPETAASACRDEAELFLDEMLFLEVRGQYEEARVAEASAAALAEGALLRSSEDTVAQRMVFYTTMRRMRRTEDPAAHLAAAERCLALCEAWPASMKSHRGYPTDTRDVVRSYTDLLKRAVVGMNACPGAPGADDPRIVALKQRYGKWVKRMGAINWRYLCYASRVALWSLDADEFLADLDTCFTSLAAGMGFRAWTGSTRVYASYADVRLQRFETFSPSQKRRLYDLYIKWARKGHPGDRLSATLCAAMLANDFPDVFPGNAQEVVEIHLAEAARMAKGRVRTAIGFAQVVRDGLKPALPSPDDGSVPVFHRPLPATLVLQHLLAIAKDYDEKRIAIPRLYAVLDEVGSSVAEHPGAFLKKTWNDLNDPEYRLGRGDIDEARREVQRLYRNRYGQALVAPSSDGPSVSSTNLTRVLTMNSGCQIVAMVPHGDFAYLLTHGGESLMFRALRFDMRDGTTRTIGEYQALNPPRGLVRRSIRTSPWRVAPHVTVGQNAAYVTTSIGLITFPFDHEAPYLTDHDDGLPASTVTAVCEVNGELFVACRGDAEGYVLSRKGGAPDFTILACSGSSEKRSCLDDTSPFRVDTIWHDVPRNRLFMVVIAPYSKGWLYAFDLKTREFSPVSADGYFICRPRPVDVDRCLMRVHSSNHNTNGKPGLYGYGIWNVADYTGTPLRSMFKRIVPVMGSIHPELRNWRGRGPTFHVERHVMPEDMSGLVLLDETHIVASSFKQRKWQLISRSDTSEPVILLPLLDGEAPFSVTVYNGHVFASTQNAIWRLDPSRLSHGARGNDTHDQK